MVERRAFLRTGLAAAITSAFSTHAAQPPAGQALATQTVSDSFELSEATITDLQRGMDAGRFTALSITEAYLDRIDKLSQKGPRLCAVLESNPDATAIAAQLDRERKERGPRSLLHGIPILLKDSIGTADRMTTTAGSLAMQDFTPQEDSRVARKLRNAGAVILGKANLSEWANFRSGRATSGWSARGGQCRNPYVLDRSPSGSSSGGAVAAAANLAAAAIATETDGSIVCPASVNGVVGLKPTVGLVSRSGIIPVSQVQDTPGPIARTVRDAAILFSILTGADARDAVTLEGAKQAKPDYTRFLRPRLQAMRIGVARQYFDSHPSLDDLMQHAIDVIRSLGAIVVDPITLPGSDLYAEASLEALLFEFKAALNQYLASSGPAVPVKSLAEVIEFNRRHAAEEMIYFGQGLFLEAQKKGDLSSRPYLSARRHVRRVLKEQGLDVAFATQNVNAIIAPTCNPAWVIDHVYGDPQNTGGDIPAAVVGYPHITVPMGHVYGLPVGISFFGPAWSEPHLFQMAYAFEQATLARRPPQFLLELKP